MRVAYHDSPYFGCCALYDHHHPDGRCWDDIDTHRLSIERLVVDFPDGWAVSASVPSLRALLPLFPDDVRIGVWTKSFASFKPGVNPAYAWEPLIWRGGRTAKDRGGRSVATVRDWVCAPVTLQRGVKGAKPLRVCYWLFDLLGLEPTDEFVDLFPGSGAVGEAWESWCRTRPLFLPETPSEPLAMEFE